MLNGASFSDTLSDCLEEKQSLFGYWKSCGKIKIKKKSELQRYETTPHIKPEIS